MDDTNLSYGQTPMVDPYFYCTIPDRLRKHAIAIPEKVAFIIHYVSGHREIVTCGDIYQESLVFAKGLVRLGIKKGDIVGVAFPNSREWLVSTFGIQLAGAVPLYISYIYNDGRDIIPLLKDIRNCKAIIINHGAELIKNIVDSYKTENGNAEVTSTCVPSLKFIILSGDKNQACVPFSDVLGYGTNSEIEMYLPHLNPDDIAAFFLTSGSTGLPKLVPKTHLQILTMGQRFTTEVGLKSTDVYFNDRLFNWSAGYPFVYLISGATHVTTSDQFTLNSAKDIADLAIRIIKLEKCTVSLLLPVFILEILKKDETEFHIRTIITSGVPVPKECSDVIGGVSDDFVCVYGSTEMDFVSMKKVKKASEFSSYCTGLPFSGVEMKIVDSSGNTLERKKKGELFVRRRMAFNGYFNNIAKSREVLDANGWYKTDDSAYMDDDGNFFVIGRCSDIIVCYGELISPSILEDQIREHPSVADVCVVPISDPICFQKVCACVVLRSSAPLMEDELRVFLSGNKSSVPYKEQSHIFLFFENFPTTAVGKIFRKGVQEAAEKRLKVK